MRRFAMIGLGLAAAFIAGGEAKAAGYPEKPIEIYVGFRPGGGADLLSRMLAKHMEERLEQPVAVINKAGAGGRLAASALHDSPADGYSLAMSVATTFVFDPLVAKDASFGPEDFTYVSAVAKSQEGFIGLSASYGGFADYLAAAKSEGSLTYSSMVPIDRLLMGFVAKREGLQLRPVPAQGGAGVLQSVLGGTVPAGFSGGAHFDAYKAGDVRVLAVFDEERLADYPDAPTLKELGYDVTFVNYFVLAAPAGLPNDRLETLWQAVKFATEQPDFLELTNEKMHMPKVALPPAETSARLQRMAQEYRDLIAAVGG